MDACTRMGVALPIRQRPIAYAIVLSVAFHAIVIAGIEAGPPRNRPSGTTFEAVIAAPAAQSRPTAVPQARESRPAAESAQRTESEPMPAASPALANKPPPAPPARPPSLEAYAAASATRAAARTADATSAAPRAEADASLARDATYHPIELLDRPPVPLARPDICYPSGASGEIAYELWIDDTGAVDRVVVLSGEGATGAAAERCRQLVFAPALKDGRAVRSRVRFVVGPRIESAAR